MTQPRHREDIITAESAGTLDGLFVERVRRSPDEPAYRAFDRASGAWQAFDWAAMARRVGRFRAALAAENLPEGARVGIMLRNCPDWVAFEQAALNLGLVVVPLYTDDRPDNAAYIVDDAGIAVLLVADGGAWKRLRPALAEARGLRRVVLLEGGGRTSAGEDERVVAAKDWLPGTGSPPVRRRDVDPHALATIVYTSGTTGRPKGVMLSHHNILSIAHAALMSYSVYTDDVLLSFLPLSHTYERTVGYFLPMMAGASVAYARSIQQLADDLQTIRPTAMIAVPRIFERIYTRIEQQLARQSRTARALFRLTVRVGWNRFLVQQGRRAPDPGLALWPVLDRLVARKIRARLGGRLRLVVSGGAALPVPVSRVFLGLGVPILQGYGMTETSPVVSGNLPEDNDPASVGVPLRHVEVRIGDDDELLVRGPGVMLGYWNNHKATAQIIDPDGWLHTGDQARIENRHIYITGRIKDILVLSNGEKVPPVDMEAAIALDPLFEQVMVVGEGRAWLTAVAVLEPGEWMKLAQSLGLDPVEKGNLADDRVQRALLARVREALADFPGYAKIRRIHATLEPWTVDNGLLTPTLKIKRQPVLERYAREIEAMYRN